MSGLRFPRIMPAHLYRDPAEVLDGLSLVPAAPVQVSHETTAVQTPARNRYYTQARRLHIRNLMRGSR